MRVKKDRCCFENAALVCPEQLMQRTSEGWITDRLFKLSTGASLVMAISFLWHIRVPMNLPTLPHRRPLRG